MNIAAGIHELIGNTPMVRLHRIEEIMGLQSCILAKLERNNPAGSAKDRIALEMILSARREGRLAAGGTVIEPTSGNTGIGVAALCARMGYHAVIIMPDNMSQERCRLVRAYGAELVLTPAAQGMQGAVNAAEEMHARLPGSIIAGQFDNPANPRAHFKTTGPEIWRDTDGRINALVAGIGTGGTISGTARFLKQQNRNIRIVGVEPAESPILNGGELGSHGIQGIGANFIPENLDRGIVDEIMDVKTDAAMEAGRMLAKWEGLLCGISSGAALAAAIQLAQRAEFINKNIVVILPDTGERYLSTAMFE